MELPLIGTHFSISHKFYLIEVPLYTSQKNWLVYRRMHGFQRIKMISSVDRQLNKSAETMNVKMGWSLLADSKQHTMLDGMTNHATRHLLRKRE